MPKEDALSPTVPKIQLSEHDDVEEERALLSPSHEDGTEPRANGSIQPSKQHVYKVGDLRDRALPPTPPPVPPKKQSSLSQPKTNGQPRTPHRVRFAELPTDLPSEGNSLINGLPTEMFEIDEDDYLDGHGANSDAPLLASVLGESYTPLPLPESTPKSSLLAAFTNMSNSIIGAGIIGLPYALKDAGLLTGIVLLVTLTVVVDWTIRLIPINSKLSGRETFQGTVEYCFGSLGLAAVSAAQWAFAFGGMVAFGVIVGDTIPAVFLGLFPELEHKSFLWLLGDRTFMIIVVIGGVSWPLSLYRDIAKVCEVHIPAYVVTDQEQLAKASTLALISMLIIIITVITQGVRVPKDMRGNFDGLLFISSGFFQSVGVISFGKDILIV